MLRGSPIIVWAIGLASTLLVTGIGEAQGRTHGGQAAAKPGRSYRVVGNAAALTTGRYTLITSQPTPSGGRLLDETTGHRTAVPGAPPCTGPRQVFAGGGNLVVGCDATAEVFALPSGPWRTVPIAAECLAMTTGGDSASCTVAGIGRQWLQLDVSCYHCSTQRYYQNLATRGIQLRPPEQDRRAGPRRKSART